jgi:hypothetical protein
VSRGNGWIVGAGQPRALLLEELLCESAPALWEAPFDDGLSVPLLLEELDSSEPAVAAPFEWELPWLWPPEFPCELDELELLMVEELLEELLLLELLSPDLPGEVVGQLPTTVLKLEKTLE